MATERGNPPWMRFEAALALVIALAGLVGSLMEGQSWTVTAVVFLALLVMVPQAIDRFGPSIVAALDRRGLLPSALGGLVNATDVMTATTVDIGKLMAKEKRLDEAFDKISRSIEKIDEIEAAQERYFHANGRVKQLDATALEAWDKLLVEIQSAHHDCYGFAPDITLSQHYTPSAHPIEGYGKHIDDASRACRKFWDQNFMLRRELPEMYRRVKAERQNIKDRLRTATRWISRDLYG